MGTPSFAKPALQALIDSHHEILAVYTKPPKPSGRGQQQNLSAVHALAQEAGLTIETPANFKEFTECAKFAAYGADIAIVAAYGLLLPSPILTAFPLGCINIHPSKLPRWRGAAPIQRAIMAGDDTSATCIMKMDEGLDTGDVILMEEFSINPEMTAFELMDYCAHHGAQLLLKALEQIENGKAVYRKQSEEGVMYAKKITADEEKIDWNQSAIAVNCKIRALSPKPGAYFTYNGEIIKIIVAEYDESIMSDAAPATVLDEMLTIACGGGVLKPKLLQRQGRKMIYTDAFLRGFPIPKGEILNS